jgi:hypothetical protein
MKVILGFHPDRDAEVVAEQAYAVSSKLVGLLDAPTPGEDGDSLLSEFDDSPQAAADAVLGRGEVWVPVGEILKPDGILRREEVLIPVGEALKPTGFSQEDIVAIDKEFM